MKNKIIISALLFVSAGVFSQILPLEVNEKPTVTSVEFGSGVRYDFSPIDLSEYQEGIRLMQSYRYGEASRVLYDFYLSYPDVSEVSGKAILYAGECAYRNNEFPRAKRIFIELVETEFVNESENNYFPPQKPSYIVKNDACEYLAKLYIKEKNFKSALKYVELYQKKYVKKSFCGNCGASIGFTGELLYADCMIGLDRKDEASEILIQYLFNPIGLTDYKEASDRMIPLLKEKYELDFLRATLLESVAKITLDGIFFKINFLNRDYLLDFGGKSFRQDLNDYQNGKITKEEYIEIYKEKFQQNYTYKLIMEN